MSIGAAAIWLAVIGLALYAPRAPEPQGARPHTAIIVGGGVIFPIVVLTAHLAYGLSELPAMLARAPDGSVTIEVTGAQWWWRTRYLASGAEPIELANELWLPVGERVDVRVMSRDVVHSFWIPPLAGKLDAIPGRMNVLSLQPTRTGTFRGACAEFCGASHARMNFVVVVVDRARFDEWLAGQARPAAAASSDAAQRGERAFLERGCAACHTIRGTAARGRLGPDLTHVGSRQSLAAGTLPAGADQLRRWIANTELLKPEVHMPAFGGLPADDLAALAAYLTGLQ
jgi:cytochrome c oxidase subunit 2